MKETMIVVVLIVACMGITQQVQQMLNTDCRGQPLSIYTKRKTKPLEKAYVERLQIAGELDWDKNPELVKQFEELEKKQYESKDDDDDDVNFALFAK